jgi:hypothetical protein
MPSRSTTGDYIHYRVGYGYWAFVICWFAAVIRASVHYCTPVPGGGVGCRFEDMILVVSEVSGTVNRSLVHSPHMQQYIEEGNEEGNEGDSEPPPPLSQQARASSKRNTSDVEMSFEVSNNSVTINKVSKL